MKIVYSPSAHIAGFNGEPCSGFFIDSMANLPSDAFLILSDDIGTARTLPAGATYTFTPAADPNLPGTLVITPASSDYQTDLVRVAQIALIKQASNTATNAPISYMGTTFQADTKSQTAIANALQPNFGGNLLWYDASNSPVAMTYAELQGLSTEILQRNQPLFDNMQVKKATIKALSDPAAIQQVTF